MFGRSTIRLGIGPHSSYIFFAIRVLNYCVTRQTETIKWRAILSIQAYIVAFLKENGPNFIESNVLPPNSLNLNPLDYAVWAALQQLVYSQKIQHIEHLKDMLRSC